MYNEQPQLDLDKTTIILGLGYVTTIVAVIGWLATLTL